MPSSAAGAQWLIPTRVVWADLGVHACAALLLALFASRWARRNRPASATLSTHAVVVCAAAITGAAVGDIRVLPSWAYGLALAIAAAGGCWVAQPVPRANRASARLSGLAARTAVLRRWGLAALAVVFGMAAATAVTRVTDHMVVASIRRGQADGAAHTLRRLFNNTRAYYTQSPSAAGDVPGHDYRHLHSTGPVPPLGSCCQHPRGLCPPDPTVWTTERWVHLLFDVSTPHRYSYELTIDDPGVPSGNDRAFTVRAYGDLDCDGVHSTFEMSWRDDRRDTRPDLTRVRPLE